MSEQPIAFGPFLLNPDNGTLFRDGELVAIGQRGALLLGALLKGPGQVRTKAELMDAAWPGAAVEESNLSVQIASLRKLLGPTADGSEWIATIPRIGYRFVGGPDAMVSVRTKAPRAESIIPSLAVLPFLNLSGDLDQDYFADGVVEDIITALSRFKSFAVIARNSSFVYKGRAIGVRQVAKELGVRYVLEGSVRRAGDKLRITSQLVDAASSEHLWGQNFDGAVDDVFEFQDKITEAVATVVGPQIQTAEIERSRRERPGSIAAYDIDLRALGKILSESPEDNVEAIVLLTVALALEPDNALLLAHAAWALEHRITMGWPIEPGDVEKCIEIARRGLERAAGDPRVMAHCGMAILQVGKEYDWGMAILQSAVEANPNNLMIVTAAGVGHLHCGSVEDAIAYFKRASRLSPRDPFAHIALCGTAHAHMVLDNYEAALKAAERSLAVNLSFDATYWMLIAANAQLGRMDEARRWLAKFRVLAPGMTIAGIRIGQPAKDPSRMAAILGGLRLAGLEEG